MQKRAFTLIELSMVLIIVGIIIGGGFKVFKSQKEKAYVDQAKRDVLAAKSAIIGNAIINSNTLPDATYFQKNLSPIKSNQHPLLYAYDATLTTQSLCSVSSTGLSIKRAGKPDINDVAFIVVSESANHNMQTKRNGASVTLYTAADKVDDNTSPVNKVENYDDVAEWVTLLQLQHDVDCQSKLFRFINDRLPNGKVGTPYSATLYVENNLSNVSINCVLPTPSNGFTWSDPSLGGTPTLTGTYNFNCTASESAPYTRSVNKQFVIAVDP